MGGPGPWLGLEGRRRAPTGCQWRVESARVATATRKALVAGPPEGGDTQLARLQGDRAHAGVGGHRGLGRVAPAGIADLGDQGRRADRRLGVTKQRGGRSPRRGGLARRLANLMRRARRSPRRPAEGAATRPEHDSAAGLAAPPAPRCPAGAALHPRQELGGIGAAAVAVAGEEGGHPPGAQALGVGRGSGSARGRRARSGCRRRRRSARAGPEGLELRAQLVGQLHAHPDQVLAGAGQRLAAPWSHRCRARALGSGGRRCGPARPGRRRRSDRTCRGRPRSGRAPPSPGWDGSPAPPGRQASRRSTRIPSGRSIATRQTPSLTSSLGKRGDPALVVGRGEALRSRRPSSLMQTSWASLAQSIPAVGAMLPPRSIAISADSRPRGAVAHAHRAALSGRHVLLALLAPRTAGRRWSHAGRLCGKQPEALSRRGSALCVPRRSSTASLRSASQSQKNKWEVVL